MEKTSHPTCDDEDCVICQQRESKLAAEIEPGIRRVLRRMQPILDRWRKVPRA